MFLHLRAAMRLFLFTQVRYTQKQGCILAPDKGMTRADTNQSEARG